jgi:hypothetical protein
VEKLRFWVTPVCQQPYSKDNNLAARNQAVFWHTRISGDNHLISTPNLAIANLRFVRESTKRMGVASLAGMLRQSWPGPVGTTPLVIAKSRP